MENLTGGTPPVRYLPCVVPCKLYFVDCYIYRGEWILPFESGWFLESESCSGKVGGIPIYRALSDAKNAIRKRLDGTQTAEPRIIGTAGWNETSQQYFIEKREKKPAGE